MMRRVKMNKPIAAALAAAAIAAMSPSAALAQGTATDNTVDTSYDQPRQEEDRDFPWGLLGLLGLAGLLGRKRQERDIHVDARNKH
jgi:MYXO-CTERM domain-containing protein